MWKFFTELLWRGWRDALVKGSSTGISVVWLGFCVLLLGFTLTIFFEWLTKGRNMLALKTALKSWQSWAGAFLALVIAWLLLFGYSVIGVAYTDYQKMVVAESKTCPIEVRQQQTINAKPKDSEDKAKDAVTIKQGKGSTANPGTTTAPIKQGDCGVVQNGGSGNVAAPNCAPPQRTLSKQEQKDFVDALRPSCPFRVAVRPSRAMQRV